MPLLLGLSSCLALPAPSATNAGQAEPENHAVLDGFVVEVDGTYTRGDGQPIEIAPGCHIVKTTADALLESTDAVAVVWKQVPVVYFQVNAVAGHRYRVERSVQLLDGRYNVLLVVLRTYDAKDNLIAQEKIAYGNEGEKPRPTCPVSGS